MAPAQKVPWSQARLLAGRAPTLVCQVGPAPPSTPPPPRGPVVSLPGLWPALLGQYRVTWQKGTPSPQGATTRACGGAYAREGLCLRRQ